MSRADTLAAWLPDERTAALITSPLSLRYLCGIPIESGVAVILKEKSALFVPERIFSSVDGRIAGFKVRALTNGQQLLDLLIKYGIKRVLVEADKMTVAEWRLYKDQLHYAELCDTNELSEQLAYMRIVKSSDEIKAIAKAQSICDAVYERLIGSVRRGMTERQIAALADFYLAELGSEGKPFPTVVVTGANTARGRSRPSERKTVAGDVLIMEFGAVIDGYNAFISRTVGVGALGERESEAFRAVSCAISDGIKALRAGIGGKVADSVARSTLNAWNYDQFSTGVFAHGIGLEDYEAPYLGRRSGAQLKADTVLAVSVEIRIPGKFGIKLGDTAVIGSEGCKVLTKASRTQVFI